MTTKSKKSKKTPLAKEAQLLKFRSALLHIWGRPDLDMILQQLIMLLYVATDDGISQQDLAKIIKQPPSSVSRNLKKLGYNPVPDQETGKPIEKGMGLVKLLPLPENQKQLGVHLTGKGQDFIKEISKHL